MNATRSTATSIADLAEAGVLTRAEVLATQAIMRLTAGSDDHVALAVALTLRAPRLGHVCLDLDRLYAVGVSGANDIVVPLRLPDRTAWLERLHDSTTVAQPDEPEEPRPLVIDGHRLYTDRYWRYEQRLVSYVRDSITKSAAPWAVGGATFAVGDGETETGGPVGDVTDVLADRRFAVLTGGPGTGKTTTIVRLIDRLHATQPSLRVALAAPTGKAAARMLEAVRETGLDIEANITSATLHRLLRYNPHQPTRFLHHHRNPLVQDIVIVDEASMVSLPLMAKLVDALKPESRLLLVGDREQLASVEAGAVLADICGASLTESQSDANDVDADNARSSADPHPMQRSVIELRQFHRFGHDSGIGALARAIRSADLAPERAVDVLTGTWREDGRDGGYNDVALHEPDATRPARLPADIEGVIVEHYGALLAAAERAESADEVLQQLTAFRVLTALRVGPQGVDQLNRHIMTLLGIGEAGATTCVGTPLMVTANDYRLGVFNGDVGVVTDTSPTGALVAFDSASSGIRQLAIHRLPAYEPVFAMSIHKSQGSQFDQVIVVLPDRDTPLLTRELVYTAVTRGRRRIDVVATGDIITEALTRRVQRSSGLAERLWSPVD